MFDSKGKTVGVAGETTGRLARVYASDSYDLLQLENEREGNAERLFTRHDYRVG